MLTKGNRKKAYLIGAVCFVILIFVTRIVCLYHNLSAHLDEYVFYDSAESLAKVILGRSDSFTEPKIYPEGAYIFFALFRMADIILNDITGHEFYYVYCARFASVCFFCVASLLGLRIMRKQLSAKPSALFIYCAAMLFSLFQIEQSRYATGDALSGMLLMLIITLCSLSLDGGGKWPLLGAYFIVGILTAVKYPLLYFILLPLLCTFRRDSGFSKLQCALFTVAALAVAFLGFIIVSPKAAQDLMYIRDVFNRETYGYIEHGNFAEMGGFFNHVVEVFVYQMLYSDIPLAPVFSVLGVLHLLRDKKSDAKPIERFYSVTVPMVTAVFLLYNLFVPTLFMRTLYPYYLLCIPYAALGASRIFERGRVGKIAVSFICVLMCARGVLFINALRDRDALPRMNAVLAQLTQQQDVERSVIWGSYSFVLNGSTQLPNVTTVDEFAQEDFFENGEMPEKCIVVTFSFDHYFGQGYYFPIEHETINACIRRWEEFKSENAQYLVATTYPQWYYYAFGAVVKGCTLANFEFPTNYIYYRP